MPLYEPQEDSELLRRAVEAEARGRVLDMGAGSGILAFAAAAKDEVESVLAVDIDDESLECMRNVIKEKLQSEKNQKIIKKIQIKKSDLFGSIGEGERFDTIICNPPYLPQDLEDTHQALYGGVQGYEFTLRFLDEAAQFLTPRGSILLLFSSLTNKERIDQELKRLGYHYAQLFMEAHFFERLYVYRIWPGDDMQDGRKERM